MFLILKSAYVSLYILLSRLGGRAPKVLEPLQHASLQKFNPVQGSVTKETDLPRIQALMTALEPFIQQLEEGYVGDRNADGKMHGNGEYIYANGGKYTGDWENGKHHGKGIMTFANGSLYEGEFAFNKKNGIGKFIIASGDEYSGSFFKNRKHGRGRFVYSDGVIEDGYFLNDEYTGLQTEEAWLAMIEKRSDESPSSSARSVELVESESAVGVAIESSVGSLLHAAVCAGGTLSLDSQSDTPHQQNESMTTAKTSSSPATATTTTTTPGAAVPALAITPTPVATSTSAPGPPLASRRCNFFKMGKCRNGSSCPYSHSDTPPPDAAAIATSADESGAALTTKPCAFFKAGKCRNGTSCAFSHNS